MPVDFFPTLPYRFAGAAEFNPSVTAETMMRDMRSFWFDTALSSNLSALLSRLAFADSNHTTYGFDFPFAPSSHDLTRMFDDHLFEGR